MDALERLQSILQTKTISYAEREQIDFDEYEKFISLIKQHYPLLHEKAVVERVGMYSLLYVIKGTTDLKPIGWMGHYDVVPVNPEGWNHEPFGAEVHEDYVYARGALDMKGHVVAMLEAIESLLDEGKTFERDLYIMLGHNEETGSAMADSGAKAIKELLISRGITFECVLDEGGAFIDGKKLGVNGTVALIGVAEKGYLDVEIMARREGGHASTPPERSALFEVTQAAGLMESNKFKADFNPATRAMFEALVPAMDQPLKFLFKYKDIFKPILLNVMTKNPETAATVRTTAVMTMASGSKAPNVLAQDAKVNLNCRIVPGDSVEEVVSRIKRRIGSRFTVTALNGNNPTSVSSVESRCYTSIDKVIKDVYPDIKVVAPYLMIAATDSRIYHDQAEGVYRIQPFMSIKDDRPTIHADNERVAITSYYQGIQFFKALMCTLNGVQ